MTEASIERRWVFRLGGWSAVATHPAAYPLRCALYVGDAASPDAAAESEGVIGCK